MRTLRQTAFIALSGMLAVTSWPAQAETPMTGADIRGMLSGATVLTPRPDHQPIRQVFYESGRTLYDDGRDSWGYWEVRGDAYCSQWPPSAGWVCYRMWRWQRGGKQWVVWIGDSGTRYEGYVADE